MCDYDLPKLMTLMSDPLCKEDVNDMHKTKRLNKICRPIGKRLSLGKIYVNKRDDSIMENIVIFMRTWEGRGVRKGGGRGEQGGGEMEGRIGGRDR